MNLSAYVDEATKTFNYQEFSNDVKTAVVALNDILRASRSRQRCAYAYQ